MSWKKPENRPLTNVQKAKIGILAREAWDAWEEREDFLDANPEFSASKCFEIWRRNEQHKLIGVHSLRDARQPHYLELKKHFENFAGRGGEAVVTAQRAEEEKRIQAFHNLNQALQERGLEEGYAAKICRAKYKCALGDATAQQLINTMIDVRKRRPIVRQATSTYIQNDLGSLSTAERPAKPAASYEEEPF